MKDSRGSRESRASLLGEVTALMGSGLEQGQLLFRLAHLVVPALGDLCAIDFLREGTRLIDIDLLRIILAGSGQ